MKIAKYLEQSPVFNLNAVIEAVIPRLNAELREEGVNLLQGLVLTALFFESAEGGQPGLGPSELARQFRTTRGNMSHILSHLEGRGWIKRVLHPEDARRFSMLLRPEGHKKALRLIKYFDRIQSKFEKELGVSVCLRLSGDLRKLAGLFEVRTGS